MTTASIVSSLIDSTANLAAIAGTHAPDEEQYLSDDSIDPDDMTYEVPLCTACAQLVQVTYSACKSR